MKSTNSARLERWLGADAIARVSAGMRGWYGPPIAVDGVPGAVFATADGDFVGECRAGWEMSARDRLADVFRRVRRGFRVATDPRRQMLMAHAGFSSISDLISEATTGGKRQELAFRKVGPTGVVGVSSSLWQVASHPGIAADPSAAPGGDATTSATTGAIIFNNAASGDTLHFVSANLIAGVAGNTLLLYDRLFQVAKTMNSSSTEAVTGVPARYTNTTAGAADSAEGNFLFVEVGTTQLANTAHNWTVCQYTDQSGNTGATLPSMTGNASAIVNRLDHPVGQWFAPLAAGDTGINALTQMQCSASVATGKIAFVIGHPLAWMPCPFANILSVVDGINTAFALTRIFDNACLALMEVMKPSTSSTIYSGTVVGVSG